MLNICTTSRISELVIEPGDEIIVSPWTERNQQLLFTGTNTLLDIDRTIFKILTQLKTLLKGLCAIRNVIRTIM